MASLKDRVADPEYRNWVKTQLCLLYVKDGLIDFAETKSKELQKNVIGKLKSPVNQLCANIFSFDQGKQSMNCNCGNCNSILTELKQHTTKTNYSLHLKNSDLCQLLKEHWQMAKLIMNLGQETRNIDPNKTDISGILNFIENCKEAEESISNSQKVKTVREDRNRIIHTHDMKVQQADFTTYTNNMLDLLEDKGKPTISAVCLLGDPRSQQAVARIKEVQTADFMITLENEEKVYKNLREAITSEVNDLKRDIQERDNQTEEVMEGMQEKMKEVETTLRQMKKTLEACKDQPGLLLSLVSPLEESVRTLKEEFCERMGEISDKVENLTQTVEDLKTDVKELQRGTRGTQEQRTPPTDSDLECLAQYLKDGYDDYLNVPVLYGHYKLPVCKIFSPVILIRSGSGETQTSSTLSSYKDLLGQGQLQKKRLFLEGEAGSGKTTFCKHLVEVWRNNSETPQFDDPEALRQFKFVFHVSYRLAKATDSVLDMISDQLFDEESDEAMKRVAMYVLLHCPEKCFIISDGLDEWECSPVKSTGRRRDIPGLPSRKGVEDCLILITSRPWRLQALTTELKPKPKIYELAGLQSPQKLITSILSKMEYLAPKISCKNFLREVQLCGMDEMIKIPLILITVLSMWEQNKSLHPSLCRNYMDMMESMVLRADDEEHWTGDETRLKKPLVKNVEDLKTKWEKQSDCLPSCCQELKSFTTFSGLILSLSQLAFNLLFGESTSDEQKLVFSKQDCKKYLSDEELNVCLGIGILSKSQTSRGMKKLESYSFPHKTVQEFLSALWLAGPGADRVGRITAGISEETDSYSLYDAVNNVEMLTILKFLSGLGPQVAAKPLQYIYTQYIKYPVPSLINPLILFCCAESQHCNNTKHVYFTFPEIMFGGETMSDDDIRMWASIVEASSSCLRRLVIGDLKLEHESVEEPSDISSCHSSIDTLYQSLSCCGNLEYLRLGNISCSDDRHDNISSVLDIHNLLKLEKLTLWKLSVRTVLWPQVTNSGLRVLYINHLKLTHGGVEELCRTYEQYRQSEMRYCEVSRIFCVDHETHCDRFEGLQQHIMLVNLPYFDDDDNDDVDSDN